MMRGQILSLVSEGLASINEDREDKPAISISEETHLFGKKGELDSLELVSLVVDIEERVLEIFDKEISLTNDDVLNQDPSPFWNMGSLVDYIEKLLR